MVTLVKPGLLFQAAPLFGRNVQGAPCPNTTYVVCQDGTIQNYHEPIQPVGWTLTEAPTGWYYDGDKPLAIYFRGRTENVPNGMPQCAEVIEQSDDGDEVTSTPPPTPRAEPVCPGTPRKTDLEKIATIDPNLATLAAFLNDPVQTSAMARFAEGKMSYAEMRGLCG
jgi:hypothetical protein